ncbi:MAG: TIGR03790 family protein, partial [Deltaproteobacteria bacterium]|nr:TIGR03790 family protein [Deltaproteobacteria bacterium]
MLPTRLLLPRIAILFVACGLLGSPAPAGALGPTDVLVVANRNAQGSLELASYYMKRRGIPGENLLALWVTDAETCPRPEYEERIAEPIRRRLQGKAGQRIRAVALVYGVPLRVLGPDPTPEDKATLALLEREERDLSEQDSAPGAAGEDRERFAAVRSRIEALRKRDREASVDSELALVRSPGYELDGWVPNPLFLGLRDQKLPLRRDEVLLVSRLDGPSEAVVRRIIDDALRAEQTGLTGTAYLDARWPDPGDGKNLSGYAFYDKSLHGAAAALKQRGIPVLLEETEALFPEGGHLPAALYCGWYSLTRYVGAFAWQKGSVGYHIASG